ncbi:MAG: hypothetical protein Ct9H90mP2_09700 [Dehalococcoidia bacterium]|nr:MAG: hypothetical protein Ct9H90mP2_09700 [Dehalococcoidia bacterium]
MFCSPLTDSMEGIMKAAHDAAMVQKFGGEPVSLYQRSGQQGKPIATTHGKAWDPLPFKAFILCFYTCNPRWKTRGANMAVMECIIQIYLILLNVKK